jgi:predicted nucleotidyltransferase
MDVQRIAAFAKQREIRRMGAVAARLAAARNAMPDLVRVLVAGYGAREVVLFGSLAWGEPHESSDIDLAVGGVRPADLWRAWAECSERAPIAVQLLMLETAPPSLVARIRKSGQVLHVA